MTEEEDRKITEEENKKQSCKRGPYWLFGYGKRTVPSSWVNNSERLMMLLEVLAPKDEVDFIFDEAMKLNSDANKCKIDRSEFTEKINSIADRIINCECRVCDIPKRDLIRAMGDMRHVFIIDDSDIVYNKENGQKFSFIDFSRGKFSYRKFSVGKLGDLKK
jgi:hypothetical protein